jgi:NADPH:quinone reductase-like Zn-dependent oxidoreductase
MKVSVVTAPGETQVIDAPKPRVGPADVLVKVRACGICGTDALFISMGGIELHGEGESLFPGKAGTDIYFDAAGAPAVINTALAWTSSTS